MARNWTLEIDKDGIGDLQLNVPDTEVNVLTTGGLLELKNLLQEIPQKNDLKALLITSAKKRIFIAGADIKEIRGISTQEDAFEKAEQGKEVFQLVEDLKVPTITVINGACLGGGYELALSTNFRIAADSDQVKIGLPEVNLGILPGFGGSIRLPLLIGLLKALPLILAGKIVGAKDALKNGMIDRVAPEGFLIQEAKVMAKEALSSGSSKIRKKKKKAFMTAFLEDSPIGRMVVFNQAKKNVLKKSKGFYPAPIEIINLLSKTYGTKNKQAFKLESEHFAKLGTTEVSKNLIKLFFLNEKYKKHSWTDSEIPAYKVSKCGVVGAGVMGGGIAQRVSYKDIPVRVKDINEGALAGALKEASVIYKGALKRRRVTKYEVIRKMNLISTGLTPKGLRNCDFIIEAVVEDMKIKQAVFKELDDIANKDAILASNTSSLSVTQMGSVTQNPERVVGLHFFNPVDRMPLVEVIRAKETSDETIEKTVKFARQLGKTVIVVRDKEGFLVNRLLLPYMNEAAHLLEEGLNSTLIDTLATKFGMPMGPIELVDQVGIDVGYKVANILEGAFGARMKVADILQSVYSKGLLGKKSGKGFYTYKGREKTENPEVPTGKSAKVHSEEDALKRMIYIMINEAARCLEDGIIDSPETVDIGMVFGTGFPPFRAGLLHYADAVGVGNILTDLKRFQNTVSRDRFEPCQYLQQLAKDKKGFHSR